MIVLDSLLAIWEGHVERRLGHSYVVWLDGVACGATEEPAFARASLIHYWDWFLVEPDRTLAEELPGGHARIANVLLWELRAPRHIKGEDLLLTASEAEVAARGAWRCR